VLQELAEPLVSFKNYPDFRDLEAQPDSPQSPRNNSDTTLSKKHARIQQIHDLVDLLPPINRNTLQYLCKFFHRVAQQSYHNAMTSARIAALMMLSVFRPEIQEPLNIKNSGNLGLIFISMITYPDEIFREDDFGLPAASKLSKAEQILALKQGVKSLDIFS
jgi:hypothetical protein